MNNVLVVPGLVSQLALYSIKPIRKGEIITVNRRETTASPLKHDSSDFRMSILRMAWIYDCDCRACREKWDDTRIKGQVLPLDWPQTLGPVKSEADVDTLYKRRAEIVMRASRERDFDAWCEIYKGFFAYQLFRRAQMQIRY